MTNASLNLRVPERRLRKVRNDVFSDLAYQNGASSPRYVGYTAGLLYRFRIECYGNVLAVIMNAVLRSQLLLFAQETTSRYTRA